MANIQYRVNAPQPGPSLNYSFVPNGTDEQWPYLLLADGAEVAQAVDREWAEEITEALRGKDATDRDDDDRHDDCYDDSDLEDARADAYKAGYEDGGAGRPYNRHHSYQQWPSTLLQNTNTLLAAVHDVLTQVAKTEQPLPTEGPASPRALALLAERAGGLLHAVRLAQLGALEHELSGAETGSTNLLRIQIAAEVQRLAERAREAAKQQKAVADAQAEGRRYGD